MEPLWGAHTIIRHFTDYSRGLLLLLVSQPEPLVAPRTSIVPTERPHQRVSARTVPLRGILRFSSSFQNHHHPHAPPIPVPLIRSYVSKGGGSSLQQFHSLMRLVSENVLPSLR